jgi:hypothetical protein
VPFSSSFRQVKQEVEAATGHAARCQRIHTVGNDRFYSLLARGVSHVFFCPDGTRLCSSDRISAHPGARLQVVVRPPRDMQVSAALKNRAGCSYKYPMEVFIIDPSRGDTYVLDVTPEQTVRCETLRVSEPFPPCALGSHMVCHLQ